MTRGRTATQLAALGQTDQLAKVAVEIGTSAPLRYCTGADPVTIGSDLYRPRELRFGKIGWGDPDAQTSTLR